MTNKDWSDDKPLPEDEAIAAAHPLKTKKHDLYAEAMRLVGAKKTKGALVELVNWLLASVAGLRAERDDAGRAAIREWVGEGRTVPGTMLMARVSTERVVYAVVIATSEDQPGAVLATRIAALTERAERAEGERDEAREDVRLAAGELLVEIPEPGTATARLLAANGIMRRERDEARAKLHALDVCVVCSTLLQPRTVPPHCEGCNPDDVGTEPVEAAEEPKPWIPCMPHYKNPAHVAWHNLKLRDKAAIVRLYPDWKESDLTAAKWFFNGDKEDG
jgi:hypothetical protein